MIGSHRIAEQFEGEATIEICQDDLLTVGSSPGLWRRRMVRQFGKEQTSGAWHGGAHGATGCGEKDRPRAGSRSELGAVPIGTTPHRSPMRQQSRLIDEEAW